MGHSYYNNGSAESRFYGEHMTTLEQHFADEPDPAIEQYIDCKRCQGTGEVGSGIIDDLEACPSCDGNGCVVNPEYEGG